MLQRVCWNEFTVFMLVAVGLYYLVVIVRFYWREVMGWFGRKGEVGQKGVSKAAQPATSAARDAARSTEG